RPQPRRGAALRRPRHGTRPPRRALRRDGPRRLDGARVPAEPGVPRPRAPAPRQAVLPRLTAPMNSAPRGAFVTCRPPASPPRDRGRQAPPARRRRLPDRGDAAAVRPRAVLVGPHLGLPPRPDRRPDAPRAGALRPRQPRAD